MAGSRTFLCRKRSWRAPYLCLGLEGWSAGEVSVNAVTMAMVKSLSLTDNRNEGMRVFTSMGVVYLLAVMEAALVVTL